MQHWRGSVSDQLQAIEFFRFGADDHVRCQDTAGAEERRAFVIPVC